MAPSRNAALNRRTKHVSGEWEQPILLAIVDIPPLGTMLLEHCCKLRNVYGPIGDFLLCNTIYIVEMQDIQGGHRTK